jgi:hypothetical protein
MATDSRRGRASFMAELRELAAAPPSTFVRTRNALVARLRKAGHNDQAKEIAARRRPTVVLWLTNQLALSERAEVERLLDASDRLRRAQLRDPGAIAEVTRQHRAALQHLMQRAEQILVEAGMRRSPEVLRRVQVTLSAAAADRRTHVALRNGDLSKEVEAGGFDVLGGAPASHLRLVTSPKGRTSAEATTAKPGGERKREERAQRKAARREAQTARRESAKVEKVKAEAARKQRSIERATRQADRLREQLRAVEARIEQERRPS